MNAQEIFDIVASHLAKQGHRAMANGRCVYRSPNGDKCAFGILIPDECYRPSMERRISYTLISDYKGLEKFKPHGYLIRDLQKLHDHSRHPNLKNHLSLLASTYNLSPAILDTLTFPEIWE